MTLPIAAAGAGQTGQTNNQTTASSDTGALGDVNSDTFLKLLVAQLKYQNPLQPTDSSQFMAQTAQFTMVEKINAMAKNMSSSMQAQRNAMATATIGKKITYEGPNGDDVTGVVTKVRLGTDGPWLDMGDTEVSLDSVKSVSNS